MSLFTEEQTQLAKPVFPKTLFGYLKKHEQFVYSYLTAIYNIFYFVQWHILAPVMLIQNIVILWMAKIMKKPSIVRAMWWEYGYKIDLDEFSLLIQK